MYTCYILKRKIKIIKPAPTSLKYIYPSSFKSILKKKTPLELFSISQIIR